MSKLSTIVRTALSASVLALASLATAPRVLAQDPVVKTTVPFDFQYESAHLQAGQYTIRTMDNGLLELQGRPQSAFGMVQWNEGRQTTPGKLVFHRYGDHYVLKEIWLPNTTSHARCPKSRSERRLEELSQNTHLATDRIEVAVLETSR